MDAHTSNARLAMYHRMVTPSVWLSALCWLALGPLTLRGQEIVDYTALGQPDYAQRLGLSDEQIARIAVVLDERLKALAEKPDDRESVFRSANQQLEGLLSTAQKQMFAELVAGGKLRFNFREETWAEVLDWFAGQASLSLMMDAAPPGTFTYSDAKNYTPSEAIDLLNSVLQSKGFTLVRREKMLVVAATSDGIPYDLVPKVTVEELGDRGRFEYVSVLFDVGGRPVESVSTEVQAFLGTHGRATPLAQTGKLLVVDTAGRVDAIHKLIQSMPKPKQPPSKAAPAAPPKPALSLKVHSATGLDVAAAIETLKTLFADAKLTGDGRAQQITAYTTAARHAAIEQTLAMMMKNLTGELQQRLEVYSIAPKDLGRIESVLTQAVPDIQMTPEPESSRLFVVADEKQHQTVRSTLEKLEAIQEDSDDQVVVYDIAPELSQKFAELLKPLLPRAQIVASGGSIAVRGRAEMQRVAKQSLERFAANDLSRQRPVLRLYQLDQPLGDAYLDAIRELLPKANISQSDRGGQLTVVASTEDHARFSTTLQQVQADLRQQPSKSLRFYPTTDQLRERFNKLRSHYDSKLEDVQLIWDYAPNQLAAHGTMAGHALLAEVLEELRQDGDELSVELHRFDVVGVSDPPRLLSMLKRKFPRTELMLNEPRDSLLAWTEASRLDEVKREFDRLVAILPAKPELILKIYPAEELSLGEMQEMVSPITRNARFTADEERDRLVVWATAKDHSKISDTLKTLRDNLGTRFQKALIAYPLSRGDGATVVEMLRELRPEIKFAVDERANQILATATLLEHTQLRAIVEQLDSDQDQAREDVARSYRLKGLPPSTVVQLLQPAFPKLKLTPNDSERQLAAFGPLFDLERLGKAVTQLEQAGAEGKVQSYDVGSSDTRSVRNVLAQLVPQAIVSPQPETRSVVVWALADDHQLVAQAISQFTKQGELQQRTLKSYPLPRGMGDTVLAVMRSVAPSATMDIDQSQGEVVVWGTVGEHEVVTNALRQLAISKQQTLEVYELDELNDETARQAIEAAYTHVVFLDSSDRTRLLILAAPDQHPRIRETLEQLAQRAPSAENEVKVLAVDRAKMRAEDLLETLEDAWRDQLAIRVNEPANSLVVRGQPEALAQFSAAVEAVLTQLPDVPKRITKVYAMEFADPDNATYLLRDLLPDARIIDDDDTRSISATALPDEHAQIKEVLAQLDVPKRERSRRTTEVYRFDRIDADAAEDAFDNLAPDARVSSVRGANVVVATATEEDHRLFHELAAKMEGQDERNIVKVYPVDKERLDIEDLVESLDQSLLSRVATRMNEATNSLMVRGSAKDQEAIRLMIEEIMTQVPPIQRETKVFRLQHGDGRSVRTVLRDLLPDASVVFDDMTNMLAVTADAKEQASLSELVEQLDVTPAENQPTKVYKLNVARAAQLVTPVSNMVANGRVAFDDATNSLIVAATEQEHARLREVMDELDGGNQSSRTQVYPLETADPAVVQNALQPLLPQARISSDGRSGSLIVSGSAGDHERVREVVAELDKASSQQPFVKAYVIQAADAKAVQQTLATAFAGNRDFSISFQEPSKTLLVVATSKNHALFAEMLKEVDKPAMYDVSRSATAYPLQNLDGNAAKAAVTSLLQSTSPVATVEFESQGNSLIVVGTIEQQSIVARTLKQLVRTETVMEMFELNYVDPWVVESAIESLFQGQPDSASPSVSSDYTSQRLFVRGTQGQIDQIAALLTKMGESVKTAEQASQGDVRTIPFRGDVNSAVERIRQLWPRIRRNRIQVVAPSEPNFRLHEEGIDDAESDSEPEEDGNDVNTRTRHIVMQDAAPEQESTRDPANSETPVVVIPQGDRITIASSDHDALDQMETLLRALSRGDGADGSSLNSDFAVFLLRNTGASDMGQLLSDLFEQLRSNSGSLPGGAVPGMSFGPTFGDVAVVADDRLNALIIHGDRKERELIEELLRVLDSKDLPNPIVVYQPELVMLKNTQAERVLAILRNVYRSQLDSGGGRKSVDIPEGVSSDVATVLQQINAAAAAPILTLDIDETTNAIVMRAPPELRQEIKAFVSTLDDKAATNRSRNVRVLRLHGGKSDRIQEALQQFILQRD